MLRHFAKLVAIRKLLSFANRYCTSARITKAKKFTDENFKLKDAVVPNVQ